MFGNIQQALQQIKSNVHQVLNEATIVRLCRELGHCWRQRSLGPAATIQGFVLQVLHGNGPCSQVPHLLGKKVSGKAYNLARARLPLELFERLLGEVAARLHRRLESSARWHGHRVWLTDGSTCSMPDTQQLQAAFGQPGGQAVGCGFPVAHLLVLFHAGTGLLLRMVPAPLRTQDLVQIEQLHSEFGRGDVVVADRGFCSYAHLALLAKAKVHGLFRLQHGQKVSFRPRRGYVHPRKRQSASDLPSSRWIRSLGTRDQIVEYFKPKQCPRWLSREAYAALPPSLVVRELRYRTCGRRRGIAREITLVTTLLDSEHYQATDLARLYNQRWQIETNLRHLKQTLGMDVLHTKTADGVRKEILVFGLVYNLVRLVMLEAGQQQRVSADRISFVDAWRWLRQARSGERLPKLQLVPWRPGRNEPRVRKRRPRQYDLMRRPRRELRKALTRQQLPP